MTVSARIRYEQHVTFDSRRQRAIGSKLISALADGTDHRVGLGRGRVEPREIHDLVPRPVQSRPDQRIHPGRDANVTHITFALDLRNLGHQHARMCGHEARPAPSRNVARGCAALT